MNKLNYAFELNYAFFEEFKKLDKICQEIYNSETGVTNYINNMKSIPKSDYLQIPNFESDLKDLIRFRHMRAHMAHDEGGFDEDICTQSDIEKIKNFHNRILRGNDPIALVFKNKKQQKHIPKHKPAKVNFAPKVKHKKEPRTKNIVATLSGWLIIFALIILWIFIMQKAFHIF